jgi:hypothetical protein
MCIHAYKLTYPVQYFGYFLGFIPPGIDYVYSKFKGKLSDGLLTLELHCTEVCVGSVAYN